MNRAVIPHEASQDHLNRNNEYSDTSYTSSDAYGAQVPENLRQPPPQNVQQQPPPQQYLQQFGEPQRENTAVAGSRLEYPSERSAVNRMEEPDMGGSRSGFPNRLRNSIAKFFQLDASDIQRITSYIFFFLCFLNLLFLNLSCSLSQIDALNNKCMTFWGYKNNCDTVSYTVDVDLLECDKERRRLKLGAAFSILAIIFSAPLLFMSWIVCCWVHSQRLKSLRSSTKEGHTPRIPLVNLGKMRWYMIGTMIMVSVFALIPWVIIADTHKDGLCVKLLGNDQTYGPGFCLGICAWILELLLGCLFVLI
ncbi:unnamed protein product [Phytomonas sp. EM1]|nr:unnamed protein product [Phytomonas sp. EM1]|eukprot:CCW62344.1 unnamed protein product [Phytomonas sp. isolate EM1]